MKNNHEYYEMLISRYKDNDLNADEISEMEKHLSSCKSCREFKYEINSMSSIILGIKPINKKSIFNTKKLIAYTASAAASLIIFAGIYAVYNNLNNNINNNAKLVSSDLNNKDSKLSENNNNYTPLSSYFSYNNDNSEEYSEEIEIMSAYIYYTAK